MNKNKIIPVLYSQPLSQTLTLPTRAEILPRIESGEQEYMEFRARVFGTGAVHNPVKFIDTDMEAFALSFVGKPFLRDHDQHEIESREGIILASMLENGEIVQDIRITTRRGMTDYVEGRIDRFSIGWDSSALMCSICNLSYIGGECSHIAGRMYQTLAGETQCLVIFINPVGIETSAVNVPAVDGTYIEMQLQLLKIDMSKTADAGQEPVETAEKVQDQVESTQQALREFRKKQLNKITEGVAMTATLRELMKKRADLVSRASVLSETAEGEDREMNENEVAEFEAILGNGDAAGSVGVLDAQIAKIEDQRARLKAALEKIPAQVTEKPEATVLAAPSALKRAAFNALHPSEQAAYAKRGGKIED